MEQKEKVFPNGMMFKLPEGAVKEKCPWIKGRISIKVEDFTKFLKDNNNNGWVNIDLKKSKEDKFYLEVDTWKPIPKQGEVPSSANYPINELSDSPF